MTRKERTFQFRYVPMSNYTILSFTKTASLSSAKNEENTKYIFERKAELKGKAKDKFLDGINLFAKKCTARLGHTFRITNVVNCLQTPQLSKRKGKLQRQRETRCARAKFSHVQK